MTVNRNIEERRAKLLHEAEVIRAAASQIPRLKHVIDRFDGKMYNKRFDEAIRALSTDEIRFSAYTSYNWYYVECFPGCNYSERQALLTGYAAKREEGRFNDEKYMIFSDSKRILKERMYKALNQKRENMLKEAAELERIAAELDVTLQNIEYVRSMLTSMVSALPSHVINVCDLDKMRYL